MENMDGISKPDMTITEEEFDAANGLARVVDGKIFLGKTDAEKKSEEATEKICILKRKLSETDYIAAKIAEGSATVSEYSERISQRQKWRDEINELESLI